MIHEFAESLDTSLKTSAESWIDNEYKSFFGSNVTISVVKDLEQQKSGIDKVITTDTGKEIFIEEKIRYKDYDDFLIEVYSNYEKQTEGWGTKDLNCDWLAYIIEPSRTIYMLPYPLLKHSIIDNLDTWLERKNPVMAKNNGYESFSLAIETEELLRSIMKQMVLVV